jgi:hypothetical protein
VDVESFLNGDYQLKVRYLTDHLQRTWTRFNFFITIESGLVTGLAFTSGRKGGFTDSALYFLIAEAAVSVVWWVFGEHDPAARSRPAPPARDLALAARRVPGHPLKRQGSSPSQYSAAALRLKTISSSPPPTRRQIAILSLSG